MPQKNYQFKYKLLRFTCGVLVSLTAVVVVFVVQLLFRVGSYTVAEKWNTVDMIRSFVASLATAFVEEFFFQGAFVDLSAAYVIQELDVHSPWESGVCTFTCR